MGRSGKLPWSAITPSTNLVPTMAFLLAFLLIVGAAAAGCGAESNGTTTTDPFKSPMQSWRESLEKTADAWARPFGSNSRRACDYMEPALCEFWIRPGSPRPPVQREFASTSVDCLDFDFDALREEVAESLGLQRSVS